jgi:hypothetical protein
MGGAWLISASVVLGLARWLEPAPSGFGTHEQLGLPPCPVLRWLHVPCPTCGLTTSFAHLARAEWREALAVQPLGVPLFFLTCVMLLLAVVGLARGVAPAQLLPAATLERVGLGLAVAAAAVWLVRLVRLAF